MLNAKELLEFFIKNAENSIEMINEELKKVDDSDFSYEKSKIKEGRLIQLHFYLGMFYNLMAD